MEGEWTPPTPRVISVFNVWLCWDQNPRGPHYPSYEVDWTLAGSSFSMEGAERIVRDCVSGSMGSPARLQRRLHHLRVMEMPVGVRSCWSDARSEHVFDCSGRLVDCRKVPYESLFGGRETPAVRFKPGDLCEVVDGIYSDKAILGIVVGTPPSPDEVAASPLPQEDHDQDAYPVLFGDGERAFGFNALNVFRPRAKVPVATERRLRRAYEDYRTLPARNRIADTAAAARLEAAVSSLGWRGKVVPPSEMGFGLFELDLEGVPGFPDGLRLQVRRELASTHTDRVIATLLRLGRRPSGVKGYSLKKFTVPKGLPGGGQALYHL